MRSILVTGCNRGLGLGLVKNLVKAVDRPENIFATCRDVTKAPELKELAAANDNITIIEIDLKDTGRYNDVVQKVDQKVGDAGLTSLFNNAGISPKFCRIALVKESHLVDSFAINTVVPILLTKALLPLLKKARAKHPEQNGMSLWKGSVVNISSILGSIESNETGGFYPYRCSKAALNAATRSMSSDLKADKILVTAIHPGWLKTDIGGPGAPTEVDVGVDSVLNTLRTLTEEHTGSFLNHDGKPIPW